MHIYKVYSLITLDVMYTILTAKSKRICHLSEVFSCPFVISPGFQEITHLFLSL